MSNNPLTSRATDNAIHSMNQPLAQLSGASSSLLMIVKREQELHSLANNNPPLSQDVINEVLAPPSVVTIPSSAFPDVKHGEDSRSPDLPEPAVNESSITSHVTGNITGEVVSASGIGREIVCNVLPQLKSEPNSLEIISFSLNVTELEKLKKQNLELLKRDAQITGELSEEKKKVIEYMEKLDQSDKVNDDLRQKLRACRTQLTRTINEANQRLIDQENELQAEITALKADKNKEPENVLILKLQYSQGATGANSQESEEDVKDCRGVHLEDVATQVDDQKCYKDSMTQTSDQDIADKLQAIVRLAGIKHNAAISPVRVDESEEVVRQKQAQDRLHFTESENPQQARGDPSHNNNGSVADIVADMASEEEIWYTNIGPTASKKRKKPKNRTGWPSAKRKRRNEVHGDLQNQHAGIATQGQDETSNAVTTEHGELLPRCIGQISVLWHDSTHGSQVADDEMVSNVECKSDVADEGMPQQAVCSSNFETFEPEDGEETQNSVTRQAEARRQLIESASDDPEEAMVNSMCENKADTLLGDDDTDNKEDGRCKVCNVSDDNSSWRQKGVCNACYSFFQRIQRGQKVTCDRNKVGSCNITRQGGTIGGKGESICAACRLKKYVSIMGVSRKNQRDKRCTATVEQLKQKRNLDAASDSEDSMVILCSSFTKRKKPTNRTGWPSVKPKPMNASKRTEGGEKLSSRKCKIKQVECSECRCMITKNNMKRHIERIHCQDDGTNTREPRLPLRTRPIPTASNTANDMPALAPEDIEASTSSTSQVDSTNKKQLAHLFQGPHIKSSLPTTTSLSSSSRVYEANVLQLSEDESSHAMKPSVSSSKQHCGSIANKRIYLAGKMTISGLALKRNKIYDNGYSSDEV